MKKIFSRITMGIRQRWKTVLVLVSVMASAFTAGSFGSQLVIGAVQSLAGTSAPVPPSELQILEANWALDAETGLVTGVDVMVTTSASSWQLKSYQLSVQIQCQGQGQTSATSTFVCSSGKTNVVLPTQGIGIRPLRISLAKTVSPALTSIQNLSFVVTDLARVPPMPPTIFVGPIATTVRQSQGSLARIPFTVTGVAGVQPGTKVEVFVSLPIVLPSTGSSSFLGRNDGIIQQLNPGVKVTGSQVLTLVPSSNQQGTLSASSSFNIIADADTFIGDSFLQIRATTLPPQGIAPQEDFSLIGEKIDPLPARDPSRPNLFVSSLTYPGCADASFSCPGEHTVQLVVENNGPAAAGPFDIVMTVVTGEGGIEPCGAPGNPACAGLPVGPGPVAIVDEIDVSSELSLAAGAQVTRTVNAETIDPHCFLFNPDQCTFTVYADYNDEVIEANEGDNTRSDLLDKDGNLAPVIEPITDKTVNEGETLTVSPAASDADLPPEGLSYTLSGTAFAAGATIDASTGVVTWIPDELDGPNTYTATVRATDPLGAFSEASFRITVNEVNQAPTIQPIADQVMNEGQMLRIVVTANDDDFPRGVLFYTLSGTAAFAGATIDASGIITWTTDESDGPGVYTATIRVLDGFVSSDTSFFITVNEVNQAPIIFGTYGNQSVNQGGTLTTLFPPLAFDSDIPHQTLTFTLSGTAFDAGATINSSTGRVTWVTDAADAPGDYTATVRATDTYGAFAETSFTITVNEPIPIDA